MYNNTKGGSKLNSLNDIVKLINSPLITPYNLIDNIKLSNYNELIYRTNSRNNIICDVHCTVDGVLMIFSYIFDEKNHLQTMKRTDVEPHEVLFSRSVQLSKILEASIKKEISA